MDRFRNKPDILRRMRENFLSSHAQTAPLVRFRASKHGRSSLVAGGKSGISPSFPDAVFEALDDMMQLLQKVENQLDTESEKPK